MTKSQLKRKLTAELENYFKQQVEEECKTKSKLNHLMSNIKRETIGKRPEYMENLTRKECRAILLARTRMIPTKNNHKGSHKTMECRWCKQKDKEETQQHIITECKEFTKNVEINIKYEDIFNDSNHENLKKTARTIINILEEMEKI